MEKDKDVFGIEDLAGSVETDFMHLLQTGCPQSMFERSMNVMLGDQWKEKGAKMAEKFPDLKPNFQKYVDGSK